MHYLNIFEVIYPFCDVVLGNGLIKEVGTCDIQVKIHSAVLHVHVYTLHSVNFLPWRPLSISLFFFPPLQQHKQKFSHSSETHFFEPNEYVAWLQFLIHGSHSAVAYCIQFSTVINQHLSATEGQKQCTLGEQWSSQLSQWKRARAQIALIRRQGVQNRHYTSCQTLFALK